LLPFAEGSEKRVRWWFPIVVADSGDFCLREREREGMRVCGDAEGVENGLQKRKE
jgi:hypothetical protein